MSTPITVNGLEVALSGLDRLSKPQVGELLGALGDSVVGLIKSRVARGIDNEDGPLLPSQRAAGGNGQTLMNDGFMMADLQVAGREAESVTVGFPDQKEAKKASWHQFGTGLWGPNRKHYEIKPKPGGKALAFPSSGAPGSFSNAVRVGSRLSRRGQSFFSVQSFNPRAHRGRKITGMTVVAGVMHPGVQPRPFFGISPSDRESLIRTTEKWLTDHVEQAGPQA